MLTMKDIKVNDIVYFIIDSNVNPSWWNIKLKITKIQEEYNEFNVVILEHINYSFTKGDMHTLSEINLTRMVKAVNKKNHLPKWF